MKYALIGIAVALAYWNSFDVPFVFDDMAAIQRNHGVVFSTYSLLSPRGLTYNSFRGQSELWQMHAVNVGLHAMNSSLVYTLSGSMFGALLFALHPIQTESVSYLSGRAELLACFFVLMGVLWVKKSGASIAATITRGLIISVAFLLAMLSKENAIVLPALIALVWVQKYGVPGNWWKWAIPGLPVLACVAYWTLSKGAVGFLTTPSDSFTYLQTQCWVLVRYIQLILVPIGQNIDPDIQASTAQIVFGAQVALLLILLAWKYRKTAFGFGLAWFLIALAPTSTVVPIADVLAEHRLYLPMVGVALMFGRKNDAI